MSSSRISSSDHRTDDSSVFDEIPQQASTPVKLSKSILALLAIPKDRFVTELYDFMERIGQPIVKMPSLGYQELDLHRLFHAVITRGGMDEVTRKQEWKLVYQDLEIPTMSTSASYNTRTNYKKYLYLYELEMCDWGDERPADADPPKFQVGDFVRIESSVLEGRVFYAQISKERYKNHANMYYVHYNGWSTSHDEWMPENVLSHLLPEERARPQDLHNPVPTRSSKSNYIIYDPLMSEKHLQQASQMVTPKSKAKSKKTKEPSSGEKKGQRRSSDAFTDEDQPPAQPPLEGSSPAIQLNRQSKRRTTANGKPSQQTLLLQEHEHPAVEDKLYGYPKRPREEAYLDYELDLPEQVFYNGGRWKHTTPQVRKWFIHRAVNLPALPDFPPVDEALLAAKTSIPPVKLPQTPKRALILRAKPAPIKGSTRSAADIRASIDEKEARLKDLKRDYKHKMKLLNKYYPSNVRGLQSSLLSVKRN